MNAHRSAGTLRRRTTAVSWDPNCATTGDADRIEVQRAQNGLDSSCTYSLCTPSDMAMAMVSTSSTKRVSMTISEGVDCLAIIACHHRHFSPRRELSVLGIVSGIIDRDSRD